MNVLLIYMYVAAGCGAVLLLRRYVIGSLRYILNPRIISLFARHILHPYLLQRRHLWGPIGRFRSFLHLLHLGGTLACNVLGVHSLGEARSRAASLAMLHLIPALFSPHLGFAADLMGLPLHTYYHLHGTLGLMAFLQGIIHVITAVQTMPLNLNDRPTQFGIIVRASCA
jgi:hypothetical protein